MLTARATAELCRILFADVIAGIHPLEELEDGYPLEQRPESPSPPVTARRSRRPLAAVTPAAVTSPEGAPQEEVAAPTPVPSQDEPALPPLPHELADGEQTIKRLEDAFAERRKQDQAELADALRDPDYRAANNLDPGPDVGDEPPPATDEDQARRKLMALARDAWPQIRTTQRETFRHALTALATRDRADGPEVSSRDLTTGERLLLTNLLNDVRSGALLTGTEPDGSIVFSSQTKNAVVTPPPTDKGRWTVTITPR
jgi:hypothetical protein